MKPGGRLPNRLRIKFITLEASPLSSGGRELIVIPVSRGIIAPVKKRNIQEQKQNVTRPERQRGIAEIVDRTQNRIQHNILFLLSYPPIHEPTIPPIITPRVGPVMQRIENVTIRVLLSVTWRRLSI